LSPKGHLRLDQVLVELKLAPTRSKAADWIRSGLVRINGNVETKPSHQLVWPLPITIKVAITDDPLTHFVSRAGAKLSNALVHLKFSPRDLLVLDVGISTGGFAQVLLQSGAKHVVGVDVGHGQLHVSLVSDPRLSNLEGKNFRELSTVEELQKSFPEGFDLVTADVSFISIVKIVSNLHLCVKPKGYVLALIKPQFELGSQALDKKGIVKDPSLYAGLRESVCAEFESKGFRVIEYLESSIVGQDGNLEFFLFARKG
jgi:23S rRNA (cytidine1920-2'-O)/16S rRNA (cytidine1409-2'-O)-methyltransferase